MNGAAWKFLGSDDSVNSCDCCGRSELKATIALESLATGEVVHYGINCAASALKQTAKEVKASTKSADEVKAAAKRVADKAAADAHHGKWVAFLLTKPFVVRDFRGDVDIFRTCQAGGGVLALRKEFVSWNQ